MNGTMAYKLILLLLISVSTQVLAKTCPGFPGYCSESFVGHTCVVVCATGRPNVPLCQDDGTWTDIPRCIEHDPGKEEQVPGLCPGIVGYCAEGFLYQRCKFLCDTGKKIDSVCTQDGTWEPYPTCPGDLRETKDGCNPCPGPFGGARNRTSEGLHSRPKAEIARRVKVQQAALETRFLGINSKKQQPSNQIDTGNRVPKSRPIPPRRPSAQSFIPAQTKRPPTPPAPTPPAPITRRPVSSFRQPTSRPSFRQQQSSLPQSRTPAVIEPKRTSPFISLDSNGRIRSQTESVSGPAPNIQQQSSRQNPFSSGFSQQRTQNMFRQPSRGRRPQSSFTPQQKQIIQEALAKLPKNVRQGSNFFSQQGMTQQQPASQGQFTNFPQQRPQMSPNNTPRRLDFNPLRSQRPQMNQLQPQSRPTVRPQPPPQRQPTQTQRQPQPNIPQVQRQPQPPARPQPQVRPQPQTGPQPTQARPQPQIQRPSKASGPTRKLSALDKILALQSKRGPTGAKFGGTPPPPTERPKPQPVALFQDDDSNQRNVQAGNNGDSFGVFQVLDLSTPTEKVNSFPQLQAFPAIPNTDRSSRVQAANRGFQDNSQFGVFETVQL